LSWKWLDVNIYLLLTWHIFISIRWIIDEIYSYLIIVSILLIISIILYRETNTWGSMWCWVCNILSFYLIFEVFYKDICKI
jgi:hypothetical protein